MPRSATIESLPAAFAMMKAMQSDGLEWGEDYRPFARTASVEVIEGRLHEAVDAHLLRLAERGAAGRRNGSYQRRILTELSDIELSVPRTRTYSPVAVVCAYTRKVASALLPVLGRPVACFVLGLSAAFHRRPLSNRYKVLMFDGVVLSRKTGEGAVKRPVLVCKPRS